MLRELQVTAYKPVNAMCTANEGMVTGMGVVMDVKTNTVSLPDAEIVDDFYFVDKEREATGLAAARTDISDYDKTFTTISVGEYVNIRAPYVGERFATDQFNTTDLTAESAGIRVSVGTDGKFKKAASASRFEFVGLTSDNGHTLAIITVKNTAVTNTTSPGVGG